MGFRVFGLLFPGQGCREIREGGGTNRWLFGGVPGSAVDGMRGTPGVEEDGGLARQNKRVLTEVIQNFLEDTGEGRALPNKGIT